MMVVVAMVMVVVKELVAMVLLVGVAPAVRCKGSWVVWTKSKSVSRLR